MGILKRTVLPVLWQMLLLLPLATTVGCSGCAEEAPQNETDSPDAAGAADGDADTDVDGDVDADSDTDIQQDAGKDGGPGEDAGAVPKDPQIDWVEIAPGTFTFGSPVTTPCRGKYREKQVQVTLTRPFVIARTEVTQRQWVALGYPNPSLKPYCDDCPVGYVDFYEAAAWCNALSELEGLETCYDLSGCQEPLAIGTGCSEGTDMCHGIECKYTQIHKYKDYYACPGYRLPTTAEWEYAAKAGTTTNTYNGDITTDADGCQHEPVLDDIGWYCFNSGDEVHPVAQKEPNPWGLYDMLGNIREWADYFTDGAPLDSADGHPDEDLTDPLGPEDGTYCDARGANYHKVGCFATASNQFPSRPRERHFAGGFRPVRTKI